MKRLTLSAWALEQERCGCACHPRSPLLTDATETALACDRCGPDHRRAGVLAAERADDDGPSVQALASLPGFAFACGR